MTNYSLEKINDINQPNGLNDKSLTELHTQFSSNIPLDNSNSIQLNQWETPILFDEMETPDIPANLLPSPLNEFAAALAQATETAESLSVIVILGVLAAAVAKRFVISPKEGWQEPVNLYTLIALPPANHKSLVLKSCTQPLIEWEQEQANLFAEDIKRQQSERKTQEQIIDALRKKIGKENDPVRRQTLIQDITELESLLIIPAVLPVLFANDTTPESLVKHTFEQQGRFAIFSDEGGITETLAGLYSHGHANVDILLKGIDGGDLRVYRKDRHCHLNPFLTIVLTIQPALIQKMAAKSAFIGNGLLERFLYVLPQSRLGYRTHNTPAVSPALQTNFQQKIKALLAIPPLLEKGNEQPRLLKLSTLAFQHWQEFQKQLEIQLRPTGQLAICQGWGGKLAGFTLRIAALLHIAEYADQQIFIAEKTMQSAVSLAYLLIQHAIAAYGLMGMDQVTEDAKDIFQWVQTHSKLSFTQSELCYAMRNRKFGKSERLSKAIQLLIDRHLLKPEILPTRKPTTIFHVHPAILKT